MWTKVHQVSFVLHGRGVVDQLLFRFLICPPVSEIFEIKVWSGPKLAEISHVFGPHFWGGAEVPEFLDLIYNFVSVSDHAAKFGGDRPRELEITRWKKETSRAFYKTCLVTLNSKNHLDILCTTVHGRPKNREKRRGLHHVTLIKLGIHWNICPKEMKVWT